MEGNDKGIPSFGGVADLSAEALAKAEGRGGSESRSVDLGNSPLGRGDRVRVRVGARVGCAVGGLLADKDTSEKDHVEQAWMRSQIDQMLSKERYADQQRVEAQVKTLNRKCAPLATLCSCCYTRPIVSSAFTVSSP